MSYLIKTPWAKYAISGKPHYPVGRFPHCHDYDDVSRDVLAINTCLRMRCLRC